MKPALLFAAVSAGTIAVLAWLLTLAYDGPDDTRAILISAAFAFVLQLATFTILRVTRGPSFMIGWGIGSLSRFAALIVWGFVAQPVLGLPMSAALVSLATFLVVTSVLEPILLNKQ